MVQRIKNYWLKVNRYKLEELFIYQKLLKLKQFLRLPKEHVDQVCLSFSYFFYLFPCNFIDAEERNASLDKNIKNGILVVFRTCIIYKLTASCLRLSFHLTFKFLVLQTNHQYFLFFVLKCKTKIKSGRSHADSSTLKSEDLTTKS